MVVVSGRLHRVELGLGRQDLERQGDPGDQPAPGGRGQEDVRLYVHGRELIGQFQPNGPLPRDHVRIVEGRHQDRAPLCSDAHRDFLAGFGEAVVGHHLATEVSGGLQLHRRGVGGHDDHGGTAHQTGGLGHPLRVVAGGEGHHAGDTLLGRQPAEAIEGAAELEGAGPLQGLGLDEHPRAGGGVQGVRSQERRLDRPAAQVGRGVQHIVEGGQADRQVRTSP